MGTDVWYGNNTVMRTVGLQYLGDFVQVDIATNHVLYSWNMKGILLSIQLDSVHIHRHLCMLDMPPCDTSSPALASLCQD